jgi:capsular exopolysaccharide synthesis family protein
MNPEKQVRGELTRPASEPAARAARLVPVSVAGQGGPPAIAATLTPMGLLRALRRRSALALGVALILAGIAGPAAWFLVPPAQFKAQARLQVAAQPPKVLFQTVETQNAGADYGRYQSTQQTIVKSRFVLAAALREAKVGRYRMVQQQVDPVEWLQQKLQVGFVAGSEVMEISLTGSEPEEVAGLVNAVKKAYMDEVVNVDLKRRTERFDQLKKIKESYGELLNRKRDTMRRLAENVGSDDRQTLALRQQYTLEHLNYLQGELRGVQSQKRQLEVQLRSSRPSETPGTIAEPETLSAAEIDRLVDEHPAVVELAQELADKQRRLRAEWDTVRRVSRNPQAEPTFRILNKTVQNLRKSLEDRRREVRPEVARQARQGGPAVTGAGAGARDLDRELAMLTDLEQRLNDEIKSINLVSRSLTTNTLDLQSNQDEVAQMELAATSVAREVEALNVELEAPPRIRLLDDATVPRVRDEKRRYMMVGVVTFGSFFGGLFGIAFLELQNRKVDTADVVPVEVGLSVVGALPILPARNHQRGALARRQTDKDRHWHNLLLESVDATRTLLLHAARTGSYRVMMISSAVGGEGKTSLATYLATSLARSGLRTLLIDADLRRPMMHQLFDRPPTPGLSELLRGEVDLDDALGATAVEDLTLLSAGRCDRQTLRILSQGRIATLFDQIKQRFDFIIVDSSPILPVADAMLIAQHVDAAVFSIFRDVSSTTKVKAACERLQRLGVPVLGAVVTGAHGGTYGSNYYDPDSYYGGLPESAAVPSDQVS